MEPTPHNSTGLNITMIAGIIAVVVLLIVGYIFLTPSMQSTVLGDTEVKSTTSQMMTFKQLLAVSGGQKCTFTQTSNLSRSSGTFYTSNGKGRGDVKSTVISGNRVETVTESHMITDGEQMLAWDNSNQGVRISMAELSETKTTLAGNTDLQSAWDQSYNYDCVKWNADDSIFFPPADIQFVDLNEMMKEIPSGMMETSLSVPAGE